MTVDSVVSPWRAGLLILFSIFVGVSAVQAPSRHDANNNKGAGAMVNMQVVNGGIILNKGVQHKKHSADKKVAPKTENVSQIAASTKAAGLVETKLEQKKEQLDKVDANRSVVQGKTIQATVNKIELDETNRKSKDDSIPDPVPVALSETGSTEVHVPPRVTEPSAMPSAGEENDELRILVAYIVSGVVGTNRAMSSYVRHLRNRYVLAIIELSIMAAGILAYFGIYRRQPVRKRLSTKKKLAQGKIPGMKGDDPLAYLYRANQLGAART